jgi:hypothetical protein
MAWDNITLGDYGFVGKLTLVQDDTAQNISTYTTRQFILTPPDQVEQTVAATFDSDGSDGVLKYTFEDGDIDQAGAWSVRARISKTGGRLTSEEHQFYVSP